MKRRGVYRWKRGREGGAKLPVQDSGTVLINECLVVGYQSVHIWFNICLGVQVKLTVSKDNGVVVIKTDGTS